MFKPKKQLGQNFLKNPAVISEIIKAAEIKSTDTIIEIGPGTGILTEALLKTGAAVFAVEKDYDLITTLKRNIGEPKNLKIVHQDALWFDIDLFKDYKVVANIPYNITSPLIRKFIEAENKPELIVIMVQKEVAERICAQAGTSDRGLLTIIVEFYADAEIILEVPRQDFYPVPKVDSAVIKIKPHSHFRLQACSVGGEKLKTNIDENFFFKIVKAGFAAKRRQIHNSISATFHWTKEETIEVLKKSNVEPTLRAEDLTLDNWFNLYDNIAKKK